ncbi:hypothetical protein MJA45_20395 [Paenibacillus aurantius]|uniref:Uncharacterized protein n=1 Tax=Paenibacillus aurantius TaxID=2918900 RepID=A0AA96LB80_9BACL|nr:hypothetical protein [Paenibacillus aurantius]WJH34750.1 hypothetical protein N6H14_00610 [Paenibacillus sp. CC-CFT747]WNQ09963.1 hypothetical protein MJA45_20395 [Paenibacillus aurantius]
MAVTVNLNSVVVNAMQTDSGVFIGENTQFGWDSHNKRLVGNVSIFGQYNVLPSNLVILNNNVVIDTPINDQDIKFGFTNQQV